MLSFPDVVVEKPKITHSDHINYKYLADNSLEINKTSNGQLEIRGSTIRRSALKIKGYSSVEFFSNNIMESNLTLDRDISFISFYQCTIEGSSINRDIHRDCHVVVDGCIFPDSNSLSDFFKDPYNPTEEEYLVFQVVTGYNNLMLWQIFGD